MDRRLAYAIALPQVDDILVPNKLAYVALSHVMQDALGSLSTLLAGFVGSPTSPASMQIQVGIGRIYSQQNIDNTAYGDLAADTAHTILKQGRLTDPVLLTCPAPLTNGQSVNYLVEIGFQEQDTNNNVLPYYNSANPAQPLNGPPGSPGTSQPLIRQNAAAVQVKPGVAATTGFQTTPGADTGFTAAYVVTVAYGQTSITSANITPVAGAPFLAGLLNQHHLGTSGQAPQIDLTAEVKNILPLGNLPPSVQATAGGGSVTPTGLQAALLQAAFITHAMIGLSGGGTISFSAIGELNWSQRFSASGIGSGTNEVATYFEVLPPTVGASITVDGESGTTSRTVTAGGIPLHPGEALFWLPTFGGGVDAGSFVIGYDSANWDPPADAVLLAVFSLDNSLVKVMAGPWDLRLGESLNTQTVSSASPPVSAAAVANQQTDLVTLMMLEATQRGAALQLADGLSDSFNTTTYVNASASSNVSYASGSPAHYSFGVANPTTLGAAMTSDSAPSGTASGTMTGGLNSSSDWYNLFDKNSSTAATTGDATFGQAISMTAIRNFGSQVTATQWAATNKQGDISSNNQGGRPTSITLSGSNDGSTWTVVDTRSGLTWVPAPGASGIRQVFTLPAATTYQYWKWQMNGMTAGSASGMAELELLPASSTTGAGALVSATLAAVSAPSTGSFWAILSGAAAINLNTDIVAKISRNGGAQYATVTLAQIGELLSDGSIFVGATGVDLTGQTSGTTNQPQYELTSPGNYEIDVRGVTYLWR